MQGCGAVSGRIRMFFEGRIQIQIQFFLDCRIRVNSTRIRNYTMTYPDNISIILTFISKEKTCPIESLTKYRPCLAIIKFLIFLLPTVIILKIEKNKLFPFITVRIQSFYVHENDGAQTLIQLTVFLSIISLVFNF